MKTIKGPFTKQAGPMYEVLKLGKEVVCRWQDSRLFTDELDDALLMWLKSKQGKAWMKKEKVKP